MRDHMKSISTFLFFLCCLLLCKMFPLFSFPFLLPKCFHSFPFHFSFQNVSSPLLSFLFFSPSEMFSLFHSSHSQFPWLLTFISPHTILQTSHPQYSC